MSLILIVLADPDWKEIVPVGGKKCLVYYAFPKELISLILEQQCGLCIFKRLQVA